MGVNISDHKGQLGMWLSENDGAKFWLSVLTELQKPRHQRHPHCLRGRAQRLFRRDTGCVPADADLIVHREYGTQFPEIHALERLQSGQPYWGWINLPSLV